VSEFTHDISIVASIAGLDPIEVYATQTIDEVVHFSRGVIDDANPKIPGTTGGLAGDRPDFLLVIAKGDTVQVELDNGDAMDVSLLKGQTFGMLSGKTFTRTTDAGDTAVSSDAVGLNTVVGGRGSTFEYLALAKEAPEPDECEACLAISPEAMCIEIGDSEETPQSIETTSGYFTAIGPDNVLTVHENQFSTPNPGTYCVYPSTDDGTPSGEYFGGTVYFFGLKDIRGGTFANSGDPGQFGFSFDNAGAVVLPAIGPLEYSILISGSVQLVDMSELDLSLLVDFQISGGVESLTILGQFAYDGLTIQISQAPSLFASSVDTIANACNPALTGEVISDGDEPNPTAASQTNRQALYDSGNWTLPASWLTDLTT
jgi:hypothetical protein